MLTPELKDKVLCAQKDEITEYHVYNKLALTIKDNSHAEILRKIANQELMHCEYFKSLTKEEVLPDQSRVFFYVIISKIFGLNFGLRLMENNEHLSQDAYASLKEVSPKIEKITFEEQDHEYALLDLIDEDRLKYVSSMILGLNDALVELTATIAGFTLALQNTKLIGILGIITGISAAMSMGASEYLSTQNEKSDKNPFKASIYTGLSYIATVCVLVMPYFLLDNIFVCLGLALGIALVIIFIFTFYISVAKSLNFKKRVIEMSLLSLGIATITFFLGMFIRKFFNIDI